MMVTRILRRDEWSVKLVGTELEPAVPWLPEGTDVLIVETDDGTQVLGCWAQVPYRHAEGLWIAADQRQRGAVGRRLVEGMRALARSHGVDVLLTAAVDDTVRGLIAQFGGAQLPGTHHVLPMGVR